jgi:hypothetical protein
VAIKLEDAKVKYCPDRVVIKEPRELAELSPATVEFIKSREALEKVLLDEWARYLSQERERNDAETAVKGFIAICVLVAIAVSFLIPISGGVH